VKCDIKGCKHEAKWAARKLFGDGKVLHTCDGCKPDTAKLGERVRKAMEERGIKPRLWYDVQPIEGGAGK
jgi:hypothetical protein